MTPLILGIEIQGDHPRIPHLGEDEPGSHFHILMEGEVYLQLPADPPEFSLAILKVENGELFGISPLLKSPHYTLTAECFGDTKVLAIEAQPFLDLLRSNCPIGMDIMNRVANIYFTRYIDLIKRVQNVVS